LASARVAGSRAKIATSAPEAAYSLAIASPSPLLPPVTIALLPSSRTSIFRLLLRVTVQPASRSLSCISAGVKDQRAAASTFSSTCSTCSGVRAHVFLCMRSYRVEWHLRTRLAPILWVGHDRAVAQALRGSPVTTARRSGSFNRLRGDRERSAFFG
jgi:hypothetical protein